MSKTMREVAFTFDWYDELIETLDNERYTFVDFDEDLSDGSVLLRHDVDWSPRKAVRLAEIEADYGATSTYFFLVSSPFYNPMNEAVRDCIERISDLGHDIGLHFSTHQYFESTPDGDDGSEPPESELVISINRERTVLETVTGEMVDVVSFHNPPTWIFQRSFDEFVSTYETRFFEEIAYIADSNQRWRKEPPFGDYIPSKFQILTHPVLWGDRDAFVTDRLREERDHLYTQIRKHLETTDRMWRDQ
jgi:peptidoglycan/xylan/chitin deacetylase (PgdA/CDA1 family)